MTCIHCDSDERNSSLGLFELVAAKVIPADAPDCDRIPLEALIWATIGITHENGTLEGTADAVVSFVRDAGRLASGEVKP